MVYDKKIAVLFLLNFNEAYRSAKSFMISLDRIASFMPLQGESLNFLNSDDLDQLDAFRVRYCALQDSLGHKVFRTILILEEETLGSNLDIMNKMEQRGIISTFENWKLLRDTRDLFSNDYPKTDLERAETLNRAYFHSPQLVSVVDNIIKYMQDNLGLSMGEFLQLTKQDVLYVIE